MTTTTRAKSVAKKNARFAKQTPAEKRVAIAKDALAWIKAGALVPKHSTYVSPLAGTKENLRMTSHPEAQLRDVVLGPCYVCAIGALFVAKAVRFDETAVSDLLESNYHNTLRGHFSKKQLALIEYAFERRACGPYSEWVYDGNKVVLTRDEKDKAAAFAGGAHSASRRLTAILRNIVANGGEFVP